MRAINSAVMKQVNRHMILDCIRRRPISRAELSDETQLTHASITQIIDSLMEEGLVIESATVDSRRPGRRQTHLTLVEDALCIAGAYCGSKGYDLGVMDLGGKILWRGHGEYANRGEDEIADEACGMLKEALENFASRKIYGMSVCLPSPVKQRHAEAIRRPEATRNRDERFAAKIRERLNVDVYIGNATNAFALDELYFGIGRKGIEDFMVLRVDEIVGAGFIINGNLFKGALGFSPEIGHITLERNGPQCQCGNRGCLELYLAIPHILKNTPFSAWKDVIDRLDEDPLAAELFKAEVELLAFEIMNLANVMDLDKVVITGDLNYGGDRLTESINRFMDGHFVHRMDKSSVIAGGPIDFARIACMPAYHSIFS